MPVRSSGLHGLDDRTVHAVGDLVRELDADRVESSGAQAITAFTRNIFMIRLSTQL